MKDLMLALDVSPNEVDKIVNLTKDKVSHIKIGPILMSQISVDILAEKLAGIPIFLDLKFFDIPNTTKKAIEHYKRTFPLLDFVTVHGVAGEKVLRSSMEVEDINIASVISLSSNTPNKYDYLKQVDENIKFGVTNFITNPSMLIETRREFGDDITLIVPGIRNNSKNDDHMGALNAQSARNYGANYLVVGRPIIEAEDKLSAITDYLS